MAKSDRCCLSDAKVAAYSGPHAKSFAPHRFLRKGRLRSADLEMNLFRAANLPVRRLSESRSSAGWRSAPTLSPKMRRGLGVSLDRWRERAVDKNTRGFRVVRAAEA
jgi:hypothetical protein